TRFPANFRSDRAVIPEQLLVGSIDQPIRPGIDMTDHDNNADSETGAPPQADPPAGASQPGGLSTFMRSPGVKFVIIGILAILLLVPTLLVWALVEERSQRANEVSARISAGWGG